MIEIKYVSYSSNDQFRLTINNKTIAVNGTNGLLISNIDFPVGVNVLELELLTNSEITVTDVNINGVGLREWLYLSWSVDSTGKKFQHTKLKQYQKIYIPFANPMSLWFDLVLSKLSCHDMSRDVHQTHNFYFGDRKILDNTFPALVREFFSNEFDFNVIEKSSTDLKSIPFLELEIDKSFLVSLAHSSKILFESGNVNYAIKNSLEEDKYLLKDDPSWVQKSRSRMKIIKFQKQPIELIGRDLLPDFYQLIDLLDIKDIYSAQINFIEPGSYTPPHRDYEVRDSGYPAAADGCCQIYIPLSSDPAGNFLKIAGVGIFNIGQKSLVINNNYYTHAVINASDQLRSVLIIRCNFNNNWHLVKNCK